MFKKEIDFVSKNKLCFNISLIMMLMAILLFSFRHLNLGTDFAGGILLEVEIKDTSKDNLKTLREIFSKAYHGKSSVQTSSNDQYIIKFSPDGATHTSYDPNIELTNAQALVKNNFTISKVLRCDSVGPQVTNKLISDSIFALIIAIGAMGIYLWIRFNLIFALATIFALFHDLIMIIGFYAITRIEFDISSIAALLTVLGYSINDSVIIYDRIRENFVKNRLELSSKSDINLRLLIPKIINSSINSTLSRTILTVCATLIANLVLILFGSSVLQGFSIVMFFGILVGTYSSIYISAPILILMLKFVHDDNRVRKLCRI